MSKKLKPLHPGEQLREEFMKPHALSMNRLALDFARAGNADRGNCDTAFRLARYFKTTPQFWMNMQLHYEQQVAEDELTVKVEREVQPMEPASAR